MSKPKAETIEMKSKRNMEFGSIEKTVILPFFFLLNIALLAIIYPSLFESKIPLDSFTFASFVGYFLACLMILMIAELEMELFIVYCSRHR